MKKNSILIAVGWINLIAYWHIARLGDVRQQLAEFFAVYFVLAAFFLATVIFLHKTTKEQAQQSGFLVVAILIFAAVYRLVLLPDYPWLTDDIFRYIWDGRVWSSGINPFRYAPADAALLHLRDAAVYSHVNHPSIPTIYAPVLQLLFRATASLSETVFAFKVMVVLFEFATMGVLLFLLKLWQRPMSWILVYAWNPLVIIETAGSGHLDGIGMVFLLGTFLLLSLRGRDLSGWRRYADIFASISLGLAVLVKFIPLLIFPFLLLHKPLKRSIAMVVSFAATVMLGYLPFLGAGSTLFTAMTNYAAKWRFNDSLFYLLYHGLDFVLPDWIVKIYIQRQHLTPNMQTMMTFREDLLLFMCKTILAVLFLSAARMLYRKMRSFSQLHAEQFAKCWILLFGLLCLITPTLHPWYILWLLPLTVFYHEKALLVLSCTIIWSYEIVGRYVETGIWEESPWIKLAVFAPFYVQLLMDFREQKDRTNLSFFRFTELNNG